ncbi:MAG: aminopeptidase P family protein [Chitinophagaceae bacterium]|nr:aminopeptidase P family protein [Chitinophagaceae bacterium]MCU0404293.1 aminopeptidase P family protein [Chitinophagaceae bacterium]
MRYFFICFWCLFSVSVFAQILSERDQARVQDEIIGERLNNLLPKLMEKQGIEMWVLICREYNEDPVVKTMLPATWLSARRRTIIVFYNNPEKKVYEKLAVARYSIGDHIKQSWDWQKYPNQWDALADIIRTRNPKNIALNFSKDYGHADGLTYTEQKEFMEKLTPAEQQKVISAEKLAVAWLETRTERELQYYPMLMEFTHRMIAEAFSEKVITPGITSTDDVVWWFRQKITDNGLTAWFHPTVDVQRSDAGNREFQRSFSERPKAEVIQPGDLLHCDVGITYLGLNTDIQQLAYVLKPGEAEPPAFLTEALRTGNRLQDILTAQFRDGKTGNEMLKAAIQQAKAEGINPSIYTHPIGLHGHAAGPTIGLWDMQGGVPGPGDYPLYPNTCYSIELNASVEIPQWKKFIRVMLEENGVWDGTRFMYLHGRQKKLYTIPRTDGIHAQ